jgi:hypothetical protein
MTHSLLTQWIEEAEAREYRQAANWKLGPAKTANVVGAALMNVTGLLFWVALIAAPIVSRFFNC